MTLFRTICFFVVVINWAFVTYKWRQTHLKLVDAYELLFALKSETDTGRYYLSMIKDNPDIPAIEASYDRHVEANKQAHKLWTEFFDQEMGK